MDIKIEEISSIIKSQIKDYEKRVEVSETGTVISAGDGIVRVYGLENAMAGELLEFPGDIYGMTLNLEEDNVGAALLGEAIKIVLRKTVLLRNHLGTHELAPLDAGIFLLQPGRFIIAQTFLHVEHRGRAHRHAAHQLDATGPDLNLQPLGPSVQSVLHELLENRGRALDDLPGGDLVDQEALIAARESGKLAGAGLDVYPDEPDVDARLIAHPNVMTLPHIGSATREGREDSGLKVIANIRMWADGHRPPDQVLTGF